MKVRFEKGYILIISATLVRLLGQISTGTKEAKGAAMFPFLFVKDESFLQPWLINHECIHFRQQFETLFIGLPIISFTERLYARFILKKTKEERYLYAAAEQEAYLNMDNPNYLNQRRWGDLFHYIRHKRNFKLIGPGKMEFLD